MNGKHVLIIGILMGFLSLKLGAQDIHFSHIHAAPLWVNPAFTGLFDGDIRISANYKSQWTDFDGGFRTAALSYDMKVAQLPSGDFLGLGIQLANDKSGELGLTTNQGLLSLSVLKSLDREGQHFLAAGLQAGFVGRYFDVNNIVAFDQEPIFQESGSSRSSFFDASIGLAWFFRPIEDVTFYGGLSAFHVFLPDPSFFAEFDNARQNLFRRYVVNLGGTAALNDQISIMPSITFMKQGPSQEITTGSFLRFYLNNRKKKSKQRVGNALGLWYRGSLSGGINPDAIITAYRLDIDRLSMTFSYDLTVSQLANANSGVGSPEISLVYTFQNVFSARGGKRYTGKCPTIF